MCLALQQTLRDETVTPTLLFLTPAPLLTLLKVSVHAFTDVVSKFDELSDSLRTDHIQREEFEVKIGRLTEIISNNETDNERTHLRRSPVG